MLEGSDVRTVTVPLAETLRVIRDDAVLLGVTLLYAELRPTTLAVLHRSEWFAEQEEAGCVWPDVEAALEHARRLGDAEPGH